MVICIYQAYFVKIFTGKFEIEALQISKILFKPLSRT